MNKLEQAKHGKLVRFVVDNDCIILVALVVMALFVLAPTFAVVIMHH
jgi:hypothetical protein